jgi:hypothetical protein
MNYSRFFIAMGLSAVAATSVTKPAEAADYQKYLNGNCAGVICTLDFPVVPAGKKLTISNTSCYLKTFATTDLVAMQLLVIKGATPLTAVTLGPASEYFAANPSTSIHQVNAQIFAFAQAGQRFQAYAEVRNGSGFQQFACHISGQLV